MSNNYDKVDLSNILQGALEEKFQYELKKVAENIQDENTSFRPKRSLTLEIVFSPDETRADIKIDGSVKTKLAPVKTDSGKLSLVETKQGDFEVYTTLDHQGTLFEQLQKQEKEQVKQKKEKIIDIDFDDIAQGE